MRVTVAGEGKLDLADELREEFIADAKGAVAAAADLLLAESQRLIRAYGPGPSPEGSTPGTGSGDLLRLTKRRAPRMGRDRASFAAPVQYAPHSWLVEYGHNNVDGTRTLPRPFVRPAIENTKGPIDQLLRDRLS